MIYQNKNGNWCRMCSKCEKELVYSTKGNAKEMDSKNGVCNNCGHVGYNHTVETKEKIRLSLKGIPLTEEHKNNISNSQKGEKSFWYGKSMSEETKNKMSKARIGVKLSSKTKEKLSEQKLGKNNPMFGKKPTEEHREKMRIAALKRIQKQGIMVAFNPNACKFIDDFGKKLGYNFQHALNGGEVCLCGFPVDGYDKDRNIIFEYDEPHHYNNKRKEKDKYKERCIIEKIHPKQFIRYDERNNRLYDALTNLNL
jgi:hypothetical protein